MHSTRLVKLDKITSSAVVQYYLMNTRIRDFTHFDLGHVLRHVLGVADRDWRGL